MGNGMLAANLQPLNADMNPSAQMQRSREKMSFASRIQEWEAQFHTNLNLEQKHSAPDSLFRLCGGKKETCQCSRSTWLTTVVAEREKKESVYTQPHLRFIVIKLWWASWLSEMRWHWEKQRSILSTPNVLPAPLVHWSSLRKKTMTELRKFLLGNMCRW